jgi:hypothetical protein
MRGLAIAAIMGAALVVACASISGADELFVVDDDGGGASSSSGNPPAGGDGSHDGGGDGGVDPPLPECEAGICVPSADGWSPATWPGFFGVGECPNGWPTRTTYEIADDFSCDCACTPNAGSCEGPLSVAAGTGFTCTGEPAALPSFPGDGGCVEGEVAVSVGSPARVTAAPSSPPTACTGVPRPVGGGADSIALCSGAAAAASAQCQPTESCVARPERNNEVCIVHEGLLPCPKGFGRRTEITTGNVDDNRTCSASCTCEPSCNGGRIEAYFSSTCTGMVGGPTQLGDCQVTTMGQGSSFRYFAGNGCRVAQRPTVQGTVTLEAPKTVCCARQGFGD